MYDKEMQNNVWHMCRMDTFFFLNTFAWLYEPRPRPRILPFVLWPHQEPALATMERCLGHADCGLEKSRSEGASWLGTMLFLKYWLFGDPKDETLKRFAFGLVSKDEASVDDPDNPDTLFWKLNFQLKQLPSWMVPKFEYKSSKHILRNVDTGSTIVGYSATGDVASGGRKTAFFMDEMAKFPKNSDYAAMSSTQYVTDSRFVVSTFKGNYGYYYDAMRGPASSMEKIVLDWKDNPIRNHGMYQVTKGRIREVDRENNPLPKGYVVKVADTFEMLRQRGFPIEGRLRTPWYDKECARTAATPPSIAEELDRDPERSGSPFFDIGVIDRLLRECTDPLMRGRLDYDRDTFEPCDFMEYEDGELEIWFPLIPGGRPKKDLQFVLGIDIAAGGGGAGSSNSVISVCNSHGEKVAQFASPKVYPQELAHLAYAMGHWFKGPSGPALVVFEANGPTGAQFSREIVDIEYPNLFMDEREMEYSRGKTKRPGFVNQGEKRGYLYGNYRNALSFGKFCNPSRTALEECKFYQVVPNGVEHSSALKSDDPSGAGHNHGDRTTADALCYRGVIDIVGLTRTAKKFRTMLPDVDDGPTIRDTGPPGSFLARRNEWENDRKARSVW